MTILRRGDETEPDLNSLFGDAVATTDADESDKKPAVTNAKPWKPTEDLKNISRGSSTKPRQWKARRNQPTADNNKAEKRDPSEVSTERADSPSTSSIKSQVPLEPRTAFAEAELIALSNEQTLETASPTTDETTAAIRFKADPEGAQYRVSSPGVLSCLSETGGAPE